MERVIAKHIIHLANNNLLSHAQHWRSFNMQQFVGVPNDWTLAVWDNKSVIADYIDFSRAFDTCIKNC